MVRRVVSRGALSIQVPSKALSGASVETRISRVRRSILPPSYLSQTTERRCGDEVVQVYKCEIRI